MSDGDAAPGSTAEVGIRVKDDPDEMTEMGAGGDASRQTSSSPETILTEMKAEPMEEGARGAAAAAVQIKEEAEDEEHGADEEDYSEGEMETIAKEKEFEGQ